MSRCRRSNAFTNRLMSKIKQPILLCLLVLICASYAFAQNSVRYRYDNFDTLIGVRIESAPTAPALFPGKVNPAPRPASPVGSASAHHTKLTSMRPGSPVMAVSKSLDGFTTGNPRIDSLIVQSAARNRVDPVLIYSIMHRESAFKPHAVSYKGARGLMQLMPGTAARFGVSNIFDPAQNIEGGTRYMRFLLNLFDGNVALALAGYNAGEGAVLKYGRRIPPYNETQEYVRRITQRYALMRSPQTARNAPVVTPAQVEVLEAKPPAPLVYERNVFAVRLPDGSLRLVSQ